MRHTPRALPTRPLKAIIAATLMLAATVATACQPAPTPSQDPVIVVAGTFSPAFANEVIANRLRADGYNTTIFQLPTLGTQNIGTTAQALCNKIDAVKASTGAAKVDLVAHSQGGLVARDCVKNRGGKSDVDTLVMLGTPNYGTALANLATAVTLGTCINITACQQMAAGSSYLNSLNAGPDVISPVKYVSIYTAFDEVVFPYGTAALKDGATNVKVQSQCPLRTVGHLGLIADGTVYSGVDDALAGRSITLSCLAV